MRTVNEDTEFGDYVVPKGWLVQVAQEIGHNLPELFAEPQEFDLRFAPGPRRRQAGPIRPVRIRWRCPQMYRHEFCQQRNDDHHRAAA